MKWIAVAIVIFIAGYTYVNLHYRKPGRAHEPYEDTKNRVVKARLETAGYVVVPIDFDRPADVQRTTISVAPAQPKTTAGGLPAEVASSFIDEPRLPLKFTKISAPSLTGSQLPIEFQFTCHTADNHAQPIALQALRKENQLVLVPQFAPIDRELLARNNEFALRATFPAGALPVGHYEVTLVGSQQSSTFALQVH